MALVRNGLPPDVQVYARRLVAAAAPAAEALMETDPRVPDGKPRPGGARKLKDSFEVDRSPRVSATQLTVTARNVAPHAVYTDTGSQPHEIRPRNARALAFEADGFFYIRKRVWHPGYAGSRWWLDVAESAWDRALHQAVAVV